MLTDEILMLQFQKGSREAFEHLYVRYHRLVYGFFRRRLQNSSRSEDLAQDTFLALIKASSRYQPQALFRSWLFGIAFNLLAAERRSESRSATEDEVDVPVIEETDQVLWVREALAKLDPGEREILMLREYEQLSYLEIAAVLKLPEGTVRSRLFRARLAIKEVLEPTRQKEVRP